jgi:hypothetical protein
MITCRAYAGYICKLIDPTTKLIKKRIKNYQKLREELRYLMLNNTKD